MATPPASKPWYRASTKTHPLDGKAKKISKDAAAYESKGAIADYVALLEAAHPRPRSWCCRA